MFTPGLVSATFKDKNPEEVIAICSRYGLKAIEWSENWHIKEGDKRSASYIYAITALNGLKVASFGSYFKLGKNMDFSTRLDTSLALESPVIRIWGGDRASSSLSLEERKELSKECKEVCITARHYGLEIALEWHKNSLTDTNSSAFRFLEEVDEPNLYCFWQPTMALNIEERKEGLKKLGGRLKNLHVYHWDESGRRPFDEGNDEWREYLSVCDKTQDHYALLEFVMNDTEEQLKKDATSFLKLIEEFNNG